MRTKCNGRRSVTSSKPGVTGSGRWTERRESDDRIRWLRISSQKSDRRRTNPMSPDVAAIAESHQSSYATRGQDATTTHGYAYPPLQSPPADQSTGSPHSPPNRASQYLMSATTLPPLPPTSDPPPDNQSARIGQRNDLDHRSKSGGTSSTSGGYGPYEESVLTHSHGGQNSEYSLGRNQLPMDSTLLMPVNLDGLMYGKDIQVSLPHQRCFSLIFIFIPLSVLCPTLTPSLLEL